MTRAAVEIADHEGLDAATMRRIAQEMGTGAMSLYRYVPKRDDLIDLMLDAVVGEVELPERPTGDWRADLSLVAHQTRAVGLRHPWQVTLARRPTLGPNSLRVYDFSLRALDGFGLHVDEMTSLCGMVGDYVASAVRDEIGWLDYAWAHRHRPQAMDGRVRRTVRQTRRRVRPVPDVQPLHPRRATVPHVARRTLPIRAQPHTQRHRRPAQHDDAVRT
ncbi:TetR/AcrR family transcriptional regulator [Dactylosporangium cerinum]|uniref:TetR/AcrR family transcriptional regulator n=1 Tax=Dactylosporangium cerinum TaxID=1434730 RepID=A0ABV9WIN6_9ACTN